MIDVVVAGVAGHGTVLTALRAVTTTVTSTVFVVLVAASGAASGAITWGGVTWAGTVTLVAVLVLAPYLRHLNPPGVGFT